MEKGGIKELKAYCLRRSTIIDLSKLSGSGGRNAADLSQGRKEHRQRRSEMRKKRKLSNGIRIEEEKETGEREH